jgi:hypothetical protein
MKIEQENINTKIVELDEKHDHTQKQSEVHRLTSLKIDEERIKLQTMAEHLSRLSHDMVIKSQVADEKLARVERVNSSLEHTKAMIINEKSNLQNDRYAVMSSVEEINVMKMDIVRQRVEYLKDKFK